MFKMQLNIGFHGISAKYMILADDTNEVSSIQSASQFRKVSGLNADLSSPRAWKA